MFWKRLLGSAEPQKEQTAAVAKLEGFIRDGMRGEEPEAIRVATAVAGLIARVAYADHVFTPSERSLVAEKLRAIHGLSAHAIDSVLDVLDQHIAELATVDTSAYTRDLGELGTRELRLEVLEMLVEIAAADEKLTMDETNVLRQLATALKLSQHDYLVFQQAHRDKLTVLK